MRRAHLLPLFLVLMLAWPVLARAEGFVSPGIGVAFNNHSSGRADLVLDIGWLSREPLGVELDTTFAPGFYGDGGSSDLAAVMGNVMLALGRPDRNGRRLRRVGAPRVYIAAGFGVLHEGTPAVSDDDLGADLGLGVIVVARRQLGVRGDIRYFQDLVGKGSNIGFGDLHFWRASVGLVAAF